MRSLVLGRRVEAVEELVVEQPPNGSVRTTRVVTTLTETTAGLTRWAAVTIALRREAETCRPRVASPLRPGRSRTAPNITTATTRPSRRPAISEHGRALTLAPPPA